MPSHTYAHWSKLKRARSEGDGGDAPQLGFKFASCVTTMGDDIFVVFKCAVGEPVVAHVLPEVLDGVEFGASWRQKQQGDVAGNGKGSCGMPASLNKYQSAMRIYIDVISRDDFQMLCNGVANGMTLAVTRTDGTR